MLTEGGIYLFSLDADDIPEIPGVFNAEPLYDETVTPMMSGSNRRSSLYPGTGHSDRVDSWVFDFDHDLVGGALRTRLEEARKKGRFFFSFWVAHTEFYTASAAGTFQTFYLPKHRKDAAILFGKSLLEFPFEVDLSGVPATVDRGKTQVELDGGGFPTEVWIGADYDDSDHVPFVVGPHLAIGDVVQIRYYAAFRVIVDSQRPEYRKTQENRTTRLVEE